MAHESSISFEVMFKKRAAVFYRGLKTRGKAGSF